MLLYLLKKLRAALFFVERFLSRILGSDLGVIGSVTVILENVETGNRRVFETHNIVTNAGDRFYAEKVVGAVLAKDFITAPAGLRLGVGAASPLKTDLDVQTFLSGSGKVFDASYPRVADPDVDNSGSGTTVVSWRVTYGTSEANGSAISEVAVVDNFSAPTSALMRALFSSPFTKTSSDVLKVIVNHRFLGV